MQIGNAIRDVLLHYMAHGEKGDLGLSVMGYLVGSSAMSKEVDTTGLPDKLAVRLDQARTIMRTMDADGHDDTEKLRIYSNAFTDTFEQVDKVPAGFMNGLDQAFGVNWQQVMNQANYDPMLLKQMRLRHS